MNSLSKYFTGIAAKRLSQVEIRPSSNQHEFNGILEMKEVFGTERTKFNGKFILLSDENDKIIEAESELTWYDARQKHETRTEYRLYYTSNDVIQNSSVGDLIIIARSGQNSLNLIIAPANSTSEKQLLWLFNLSEVAGKFIVKNLSEEKQELGFAAKYIIESIGLELDESPPDYLELILSKFGNKFPSTAEFSEFARFTLKEDVSAVEDPDLTLIQWMEREELLFRILERNIVQEKLKKGFGNSGIDVDDFVAFSLSVQNRRKSRAGFAFENHLSKIFDENKIYYSRGKVTELNKKPDFVFPGIDYYKNENFSTDLLTMLGLKTTAKDRWRQILAEAARIKNKHLITLEPAISRNQTDEMKAEKLQLVIPKGLFETYTSDQQNDLLNLSGFLDFLKKKQTSK